MRAWASGLRQPTVCAAEACKSADAVHTPLRERRPHALHFETLAFRRNGRSRCFRPADGAPLDLYQILVRPRPRGEAGGAQRSAAGACAGDGYPVADLRPGQLDALGEDVQGRAERASHGDGLRRAGRLFSAGFDKAHPVAVAAL